MVRLRKVKGRTLPLLILEKENIEAPVVTYAKRRGIRLLKLNTAGNHGWPDRCFFVPGGRPVIIEFKVPGGEPSRQQDDHMGYLKRMGYDVYVVEEVAVGIAILEKSLEAAQVSKERSKVPPR